MNDLDKEIKKVITKEITLSEDFKSSVRNTIEDCFQNSKKIRKRLAKKNTVEHRFFLCNQENYYSNINRCKHNNSICCNNKKF